MRLTAGSGVLMASLLSALLAPCQPMAAPGDLLETSRTNVNVRADPTTEAAIVTRINSGDRMFEVRSEGDWYLVELPDIGQQGWIYGPLLDRFTDLQSKPAAGQSTASRPQPSTPAGDELSAKNRLMSRLTAFDESLVGNAERGEAVFYKCGSCHTTVAGVHAQGPSLYGVFGRRPAQAQGYEYSDGMHASAREGVVWDEPTLDRFIQRPPRIVEGTTMPFSGIRNAQDRRDLIAYMKRL